MDEQRALMVGGWIYDTLISRFIYISSLRISLLFPLCISFNLSISDALMGKFRDATDEERKTIRRKHFSDKDVWRTT